VAQKFFGQVWGNSSKNPSHPKHLPAPTPMHSYDTLLNFFARPWYWDQPRKTLKRETVLNLNLVKNYQVSNRKCS